MTVLEMVAEGCLVLLLGWLRLFRRTPSGSSPPVVRSDTVTLSRSPQSAFGVDVLAPCALHWAAERGAGGGPREGRRAKKASDGRGGEKGAYTHPRSYRPSTMSAAAARSSPAAPAPAKLSTAESFAMGSLAASTAVLFSNPAESVKTRMQLQGELLEKGGPNQKRLYKNAFDCLVKTAKTEGVAGVQRGLGAALIYQVCLNGSRLGFYEPFRTSFNKMLGKDAKEVWAPAAFAAGASSGVVGGKWAAGKAAPVPRAQLIRMPSSSDSREPPLPRQGTNAGLLAPRSDWKDVVQVQEHV